jgi:hypothetical protein
LAANHTNTVLGGGGESRELGGESPLYTHRSGEQEEGGSLSSMRHSESPTVGARGGGSAATVLGQGAGARRLGGSAATVLGQGWMPGGWGCSAATVLGRATGAASCFDGSRSERSNGTKWFCRVI